MRCRPVAAAGHAFEHVAEVDDERVGDRRRRDPTLAAAHLEPSGAVLAEDGDQPVVGVLAHAPLLGAVGKGWVVEDPEQHDRIRGEMAIEPLLVEAERAGDGGEENVPEVGERVDVLEHRFAQPRRPGRELVRSVQRHAGPHPRIVGPELLAEVEPFLHVGHARGQLAADGEPSPPRAAAVRHRDRRLLRVGQREELAGE